MLKSRLGHPCSVLLFTTGNFPARTHGTGNFKHARTDTEMFGTHARTRIRAARSTEHGNFQHARTDTEMFGTHARHGTRAVLHGQYSITENQFYTA